MLTFATADHLTPVFCRTDSGLPDADYWRQLGKQLKYSDRKLLRRKSAISRKEATEAKIAETRDKMATEKIERDTIMRANIAKYAQNNKDNPATAAIAHDMALAADLVDNDQPTMETITRLIGVGGEPSDNPFAWGEGETDEDYFERLNAMIDGDAVAPTQRQPQDMFPLSAAWRVKRPLERYMPLETYAYHAPQWHDCSGGIVTLHGDNGIPPPSPEAINGPTIGLVNERRQTYPLIETYRAKLAILSHFEPQIEFAVECCYLMR